MQDRCENTVRKSKDNKRNAKKGRGYIRSILAKMLLLCTSVIVWYWYHRFCFFKKTDMIDLFACGHYVFETIYVLKNV